MKRARKIERLRRDFAEGEARRLEAQRRQAEQACAVKWWASLGAAERETWRGRVAEQLDPAARKVVMQNPDGLHVKTVAYSLWSLETERSPR